MLTIDGSKGEGGGQILRSSLTLSALTGRAFQLNNIRAGRSKPGLRPQHLTAVLAAAAICNATLTGATVNSQTLRFEPTSPPQGANYHFNVADQAKNGSAGAMTLVLQTLLWPLCFANQPSSLTLIGGTHVPYSPPYHYIEHVALPAFVKLGLSAETKLKTYGWMPNGEGEISATIQPVASLKAATFAHEAPTTIGGVAAVSNLPSHIPNRMARRAHNLLEQDGFEQINIEAVRAKGPSTGAGIFLWVEGAGFGSLGRKGVSADKVADNAVDQYRTFADNQAATDEHLADQLLLPMALAVGTSTLTTARLTQHTLTNANLLRQWLDVSITINGALDQPGSITVEGLGYSAETT